MILETRAVPLFFGVFLSGLLNAAELEGREETLSPDELARMGVTWGLEGNGECDPGPGVRLSVPRQYQGAAFSGARMETHVPGNLLQSASISVEEPDWAGSPANSSQGVHICMEPAGYDFARVRLKYEPDVGTLLLDLGDLFPAGTWDE